MLEEAGTGRTYKLQPAGSNPGSSSCEVAVLNHCAAHIWKLLPVWKTVRHLRAQMLSLSYKDEDMWWGHTDSLLTILFQALRCPHLWLSRPPLCGLKYVCVCGNCENLTKIVRVSVAGKGLQEKTNRRRDCTCTHVCVSGGPIWTEAWDLLSVSHFSAVLWFSSSDRPRSGNWH